MSSNVPTTTASGSPFARPRCRLVNMPINPCIKLLKAVLSFLYR